MVPSTFGQQRLSYSMVEEVPFLQSPESPNLLGAFLELSRIFDCTDRTSVAARQQYNGAIK